MRSLTEQLNALRIPFTFKALSDPSDYKRNDSGTLYFERSKYKIFRQIIQTVYAENKLYFQSSVSLFTKLLAAGLSLAEKPEYKETTQERFGLNRYQIVANGLLDAWYKEDSSPTGRIDAISQHFSLQGIDFQRFYLNPSSQDIYTLL